MNQKSLSKWLKFVTIGVALCGGVIYWWVFPLLGDYIVYQNPEFSHAYLPWIVFIWLTAVPCYTVLLYTWRIAGEIQKDNSFSMTNAQLLKKIAGLALFNSAFFFLGNIVYLLLEINHPGIVIMSLVVVFFGIAIAIAAAVLSHLIRKGALLKEESDLTI